MLNCVKGNSIANFNVLFKQGDITFQFAMNHSATPFKGRASEKVCNFLSPKKQKYSKVAFDHNVAIRSILVQTKKLRITVDFGEVKTAPYEFHAKM